MFNKPDFITSSTDNYSSLDSEDDYRTGSRNVSHQQQFFSELHSPGRSHYTNYWYSWVQTIYFTFLEFDLNLLKQSIFISFDDTGQSSHSPSYCCGCYLCPAIFNRRVWSINSKEWLWGANQSSLLFIWSVRLFIRSIFFTFCIVNLSFYRVNFFF